MLRRATTALRAGWALLLVVVLDVVALVGAITAMLPLLVHPTPAGRRGAAELPGRAEDEDADGRPRPAER